MKIIAIAAIILFELSFTRAHGAGLMEIEGVIKSHSPSEISILSRGDVFVIDRAKLMPDQIKELKTLKAGAKIKFMVPTIAIKDFTLAPANSKKN